MQQIYAIMAVRPPLREHRWTLIAPALVLAFIIAVSIAPLLFFSILQHPLRLSPLPLSPFPCRPPSPRPLPFCLLTLLSFLYRSLSFRSFLFLITPLRPRLSLSLSFTFPLHSNPSTLFLYSITPPPLTPPSPTPNSHFVSPLLPPLFLIAPSPALPTQFPPFFSPSPAV